MKILVNGCSFTQGIGWPELTQQPEIWPNLLASSGAHQVTNIARAGSSNNEIMLRTVEEVLRSRYDLVIVQWTELRRHWLEPGLDRWYPCATPAQHLGKIRQSWQHHDIHLSPARRQQFEETLLMLTGDYKAVWDLITYCEIIKAISPKVLFLNGLVPWTQDLATLPTGDLASHFSDFTKSMLEFEHKDDDEIILYHSKIRDRLLAVLPDWVNPWHSWFDNLIDVAPQGHHPGTLSNEWMWDQLRARLT